MTLKQRREALGLSQTEVARRCGVAQATISHAETGASPLSMTTVYKLAKGYRWPRQRIFDALNEQRRLEARALQGRAVA